MLYNIVTLQVFRGKFAYIAQDTVLQNLLLSEYTDPKTGAPLAVQAKERFYATGFCFAMPQGSPLTPVFNDYIARLVDAHLTFTWIQEVMYKNSMAAKGEQGRLSGGAGGQEDGQDAAAVSSSTTAGQQGSAGDEPVVALSLYALSGVFGVLGAGMALSLLVFGCEQLAHNWHKLGGCRSGEPRESSN